MGLTKKVAKKNGSAEPAKKKKKTSNRTNPKGSPTKDVMKVMKVATKKGASPLKKTGEQGGMKAKTSGGKRAIASKRKKGTRKFASDKAIDSPDGKKKKISKSQMKMAVQLNRGVVYFSNLPHGFYAQELRKYCSQFGTVTGVYMPRSDHGNSKGYAFVEFAHPEVAEVVADTMNNYLMFNRLIKTKLIPIEEQKPWIFLRPINTVKRAKKRKSEALEARERTLTPEEEAAYLKRKQGQIKRLKNKLASKGLNYDFTVAT